jgi:hypothetical protein
VDLSGWSLDDGTQDGEPYRMPRGTVLQPGALMVLYRRETGLALDDAGGEVLLLGPNGSVANAVKYDALGPDASYSRDEAGGWHADWVPSPGKANEPDRPTPGADAGAVGPREMRLAQHL